MNKEIGCCKNDLFNKIQNLLLNSKYQNIKIYDVNFVKKLHKNWKILKNVLT